MTLAIHGGEPVRTRSFPERPGLGKAEYEALKRVFKGGVLSGFRADEEAFLGGPEVRALEDEWEDHFQVDYAVSMNSATSCLEGAMAALKLAPTDEVIVTPWSMSASVSCVLRAGAVPVFADIEPETFGLDPESVAARVTSRTKAVVVVDLFGCPARLREIGMVCAEHGLILVEDACQAPGAIYEDQWAGTLGHIGVFSLNYHKTIQTGEGGIAVTNREEYAHRMRLYRNHGETLAGDWKDHKIIGGNYRLGEMEAAMARVQLGKLGELTLPRVLNARRITEALQGLDGLVLPPLALGDRGRVFYLYAVRVEEALPGSFMIALKHEGIPVQRYVEPLWKLPAFRGYVADAFDVGEPPTPECERAYREVFVTPAIHAGMKPEDVDDVIAAIQKVHEHGREL